MNMMTVMRGLATTSFAAGAALSLALLADEARAQDTLTAGTTVIGTMTSPINYGSSYAGFWRSGAVDYSFLTDGTNSFINAPVSTGGMFFRTHNADVAYLGADHFYVNPPTTIWGTLYVGGAATVNGLTSSDEIYTTAPGGTAIFGRSTQNSTAAMGVYGQADHGWGGWFYGTTGGVYSEGQLKAEGNITTTSNAYKPGGGSWLATSDARVKKDVVDFQLGLSDLENVRPVRYKYNGLGETIAGDKEYVGVIAQDIEKVLPFMVSSQKKKLHAGDKDTTDIKEVDPSAFTYMLVNAVKQLSEENREMKRVICLDHPSETFCPKRLVARR
jgi:hypothetical protein